MSEKTNSLNGHSKMELMEEALSLSSTTDQERLPN